MKPLLTFDLDVAERNDEMNRDRVRRANEIFAQFRSVNLARQRALERALESAIQRNVRDLVTNDLS